MRTFCAWSVMAVMFVALGLCALSLALGLIGLVAHLQRAGLVLGGAAYWMLAAQLLFLASYFLQPRVYQGGLNIIARFFRSKVVVSVLGVVYVGAFLYMYFVARVS